MSKPMFWIMLGLLLWRPACCKLDKHMRVVDKLEAVVIVGFDKPPECVQPPSPSTGREANVGTPTEVWVRAVRFDQVLKPLTGRRVQLEVVDVFGKLAPASQVSISPGEVTTSATGFNDLPISITCNTAPGEYRIRVTYDDKQTKSNSYSSPLLCRNN